MLQKEKISLYTDRMTGHCASVSIFNVCLFLAFFLFGIPTAEAVLDSTQASLSLRMLAQKFNAPDDEYRPFVWWHWMGSNFSIDGIRKDLEAMKEAGIGGATIFNLASAVQETHAPTENNPWPEQTYRSRAYWDAIRFAASEAKRMGLKLGIHNSPGYATSGGPWITEEQGMQTLVLSRKEIDGNQQVLMYLDKPELPVYKGLGTTGKQATFYRDVAVMAVPANAEASADDVLDISDRMNVEGFLNWQAPEGRWTVYRIGHAPAMSNPHPLPDELIGKTLEVDKMSREANVYHWQQLLTPLVEHLKEYIGVSFTFIHIDSYEAGDQDWTPTFRNEFVRMKGYDPLPWIALRYSAGSRRDDLKVFNQDYKDVVNRLFINNGWAVAKEMINRAGLQFFWEPYAGPFDQFESISLADVPMDEFWTGGSGAVGRTTVLAAKHYGKRIVAAEAFTGRPEISRYTEDPAFLKHSADGSFVSGVNWLFLHHWVHQPFDDRYQPGMGMGWWGTHFGRHQTWFKPGKAFFLYLARCQMMLQRGTYIQSDKYMVQRRTPEAELFFVTNPDNEVKKTCAFPVTKRTPELWDAYRGTIRRTALWREQGDSVYIDLNLHPDESVFVVFPLWKGNYPLLPEIEVLSETYVPVTGKWNVCFEPKLEKPFRRNMASLVDLSSQKDHALKYFSGTAKYEKNVRIRPADLDNDKQIAIDLGELHDIAELEINGQNVGVLWTPPYKADVTPFLKSGDNKIVIYVTVNWANRLIGDEQFPSDFEWGTDRGEQMGRAMKAYPDWFINNLPRPSRGRKTFNIWYYFRKDSTLQPAGLIGPVRLVHQTVEIRHEKIDNF
ncbi:MAG: hypothetical protein LBH60_01390 [Prevotellaceae bacterium]|jgi:hypothetical protein|nr:hypothetical protein [Prevotellaceae bacterium]